MTHNIGEMCSTPRLGGSPEAAHPARRSPVLSYSSSAKVKRQIRDSSLPHRVLLGTLANEFSKTYQCVSSCVSFADYTAHIHPTMTAGHLGDLFTSEF